MGTIIKCVVVGDGTVGKTKLLTRYVTKEYSEEYTPTVFENYAAKESVNGKEVTLHLFDTAGQEEYQYLRTFSYAHTSVFILCYAVDCTLSFNNIKEIWVPEIRKNSKAPIVLVCTKVDLRDNSEQNNVKYVSKVEGMKLSREIKAHKFIECSAKEHINIENVFNEALYTAVEKKESNYACQVCRPFGNILRLFKKS